MPVKEKVLEGEGKQAKSKSFLLLCPYIDLQQEVWPLLKVCLPATESESKVCIFLPQGSRLEIDSPTSNQAENLSHMYPLLLGCSSSRCSQVGNRE